MASGSRTTAELIADDKAENERKAQLQLTVTQALLALGVTPDEVARKLEAMQFLLGQDHDAAVERYLGFILGAECTVMYDPHVDGGSAEFSIQLLRERWRRSITFIDVPTSVCLFLSAQRLIEADSDRPKAAW